MGTFSSLVPTLGERSLVVEGRLEPLQPLVSREDRKLALGLHRWQRPAALRGLERLIEMFAE
mgnify:CR=1 FL=1